MTGVLISCDAPEDPLFTPPVVAPVEIEPGLYRLTFNPGPDVVRGFDASGERVLYRSRGLAGFGDDWRILSIPAAGGQVHEVAGLYRQALINPPGAADVQATRRIFTVWREPVRGVEYCGVCPAQTASGIAILRLEPTDGPGLSTVPTRALFITTTQLVPRRVRMTPAEVETRTLGTNPFGPAVPVSSDTGYYSDGESVWRFDVERPDIPADSLGPGAFPAVSRDGRLLAAAVPVVRDSSSTGCGDLACTQETVEFQLVEWMIRVYDLSAGTARDLTTGVEPRFHPTDPRLLVRRPDGLYWVYLETGVAEGIPGTAGAVAAAIAPDGSRLAFSMNLSGNADILVLELSP